MKIEVKKIGGIWHGTIAEHPVVDERGLTEEIARRKVEAVAAQLTSGVGTPARGAAANIRARRQLHRRRREG